MGCGCWNYPIQEEHRFLDSQRGALKSFLGQPAGPRDRRIHLSKILSSLDPCLCLHLQREEQALFPALENLPGAPKETLALLRTQHDDLRTLLDRLARLLEDRDKPWAEICEAGESLAMLLEHHEEREARFLSEVLEFYLQPQQLTDLAREFKHAASCGCREET